MVIVSQTLSRPVIINTNRHYDYDIFNRQIHLDIKSLVSSISNVGSRIAGPSKRNLIMWNESRMLWTSLTFTIYWMQIVYHNQLLNVPQWKLTSDTLTFLVELIPWYKIYLSDISFHWYRTIGQTLMSRPDCRWSWERREKSLLNKIIHSLYICKPQFSINLNYLYI